jgi:hypothetical protein
MREIKFRAWSGGKMREPFQPLQNSYISDPTAKWPKGTAFMQFTGLRDKNGKEIYEGDITNNGVVNYLTELSWDSGGSLHPGFYFEALSDLQYHTGFDEEIEVIGNIYENPELLTVA